MKNILIYTIIASAIFASSCKKKIDLDVDDKDKKIVLNSVLISDNDNISLNLSISKSILDNKKTEFIDNASIILEENGTALSNFTYTSNGNYTLNHHISEGAKYNITVNANNLKQISSETVILNHNEFEIIDTARIMFEEEEHLKVKINIKNSSAESYFFIRCISLENEYPMSITSFDAQFSDVVDGNTVLFTNSISGAGDFNFEFIIPIYAYDYEYRLNENLGDLYVVLSRVEESLYKYALTKQKQMMVSGSPFAEPVQIYNNIENGFGIFASESMHADSLVVQ